MKTIKRYLKINASQEKVFDLTQNYTNRLHWDPYLKEAYLLQKLPEPTIGVDSFCKNKYGTVMVSRYISYNRPHVAAVTMIKGPWILKKFSGAWNVKSIGRAESELIFTYNFELKGNIFGQLLLPLIRFYFAREMVQRLKAFKSYIELNNS